MQTFVKNHTLKDEDCVVVFMDLETSGLSTVRDRIVEIGAYSLDGIPFSTVVDPGLKSEDLAASTAVHGIGSQEIMQGPCFATAYERFCDYVENIADMAVVEDGSSDDDEPRTCHLRDPRPLVILAGHNTTAFDFPFLLSECLRHGCNIGVMERWVYVDTLDMVRAIGPVIGLSCFKLQCLDDK
jgi:DNA polymerase III epsilon subunit-like protein